MTKLKESNTMKNYLVFTVNHVPHLFNVVGEKERDQTIERYARTYPSIPVWVAEVKEGKVAGSKVKVG
jgi:hypothetical protein